MSYFRRLYSVLDFFRRREAVEAELDAELKEFYQTIVDRYTRAGMPEHDARRLARLKFGGTEQVKERVRETRGGFKLDSLLRDVRHAFRTIRKAPVFGFVTVTALAVGIGANATIFAIVNRFVLQTPPVRDPSTLISLHTLNKGECCNNFSWPQYTDVRDQNTSFSGLSAYYELVPASIGGNGDPERVWGQAVTANFFDVTQLPLSAGRGFLKEEETLDRVVLGYGLWQRRFAGDPHIIGKAIYLSGRLFVVTGVAPPNFRGLDLILDCQFWVPLGVLDELQPNTVNQARNYHWLGVVGRLQPGIQPKQVASELNVIAQRMANAHPDPDKDLGFRFDRAGSMPPRDQSIVMMFLATLSVVALLVLCIACSNVANLSLAQAVERRKDMAVRLALGAARVHLLRQLTIESVLLALAGGVCGVLLSLWATRALGSFRLPAPVPLNLVVTVDWHVLLYVFVLSVVTGILFGLIPAWIVIRPLLNGGLTGGEISGQPGRFWSIRNLLVVSQFAMSLILLCATSLFLRSLSHAANIEIGFRSNGLLMMSVDPRLHGYSPEKINQFLTELRRRVSGLPGVISAACTDAIPLNGGHRSDGFVVDGRQNVNGTFNVVELYMASPGYFSTMGIKKLAGQDFADESANGPKVAIVNRAFVQTLFSGENPLGARVRDGSLVYQIVGVVANTKSRTLGEDFRPVLYRTLTQSVADDPSREGYSVIVRYSNAPGSLTNAVRKQIHDLDPTLAIFDATTMEEHLRDALFLPRLTAVLFGIFGFIGLLMASVGLYGVMSYWVTRRTREIGIRLAIGASGNEVQRLILRQGMTLTLIAVVPGLAIAWAGAKLLSSFLYGVPVHDRVTFTLVPLFLAAVTLAASWFPGRRASRVDPSIALRHD